LEFPSASSGLGEKMDDLEEFDLDEYLHGLLLGEEKRIMNDAISSQTRIRD
jgi:hypothetical protein